MQNFNSGLNQRSESVIQPHIENKSKKRIKNKRFLLMCPALVHLSSPNIVCHVVCSGCGAAGGRRSELDVSCELQEGRTLCRLTVRVQTHGFTDFLADGGD